MASSVSPFCRVKTEIRRAFSAGFRRGKLMGSVLDQAHQQQNEQDHQQQSQTATGTVTPWQRINAACLGAPASGLQRNVPLFHRGDGALPNHTANPVDPVKSSHDLSHLKVTVFTTPHTALFCARVTGARACGQRRLRFLPGNRNWSDRDLCAPPYRLHLRIPITSHMHQ